MIETLLRAQAGDGQGHVHEVGHPLDDDGPGHQDRHRCRSVAEFETQVAVRQPRSQGHAAKTVKEENIAALKAGAGQGDRAWCSPTSAGIDRQERHQACATSSAPAAASTGSSRTRSLKHRRQGHARWRASRSSSAGPTAIAYSLRGSRRRPPRSPPRSPRSEEKFNIKGGYVDGKVLDARASRRCRTMPGKDELRATLLATLLRRAAELRPAHHRRPAELRAICWPRAKRALRRRPKPKSARQRRRVRPLFEIVVNSTNRTHSKE